MDRYLSRIAQWLEHQHVKLETRIQAQVHERIFSFISNILVKVKVSPLQAMKAHGECGYKGPHIHSQGTRMR